MSWGEPPERLEVGPRRSPRAFWLLAVAAVLAGVLYAVSGQADPASAPLPAPSVLPGATDPTLAPPSTTTLGEPVVDGATGTLWARSAEAVYAVDLATGGTATTSIEGLQSSGPVSFVGTSDEAVVRPLDNVPGWAVRRDTGAQPLPGKFPLAHQVFPGPSGRFWIDTVDGGGTMITVDAAGKPTGSTVTSTGTLAGDGAGGLLLTDAGGVWAVADGSFTLLSSGTLTGTGAHHLRFTECDARHHCQQVLLDRRTGERTVIGPAVADQTEAQLSPDGHWLARTVDAHPGTAISIAPVIGEAAPHQFLSFAADLQDVQPGVWLDGGWYVLPTDGHLTFYQPGTGREVVPELPLSGVIQLSYAG